MGTNAHINPGAQAGLSAHTKTGANVGIKTRNKAGTNPKQRIRCDNIAKTKKIKNKKIA